MFNEDAVIDALAVAIKEEATYFASNVSLGNPAVLDGSHDTCIIINTGQMNVLDGDTQAYFLSSVEYLPTVEVYYRYSFDAEARENLRLATEKVMTRITSHPTLSGTAVLCKCINASDIEYMGAIDGSGPYYVRRIIRVSVTKLETMTLNE